MLIPRNFNDLADISETRQIVENALAYNKFPAFCATLFASYTLLEHSFFLVARWLLDVLLEGRIPDRKLLLRLCRTVAGLTASSLSFRLLNRQDSTVDAQTLNKADEKANKKLPLAGRTLDFTLLITIRAVEALIGESWRRYYGTSLKRKNSLQAIAEKIVANLADPAVFMASAGIVMWAWFYTPERLPHAYQKWIGEAAAVDERLVQTLRNCRSGKFVYGKQTGRAPLLQGMCQDYNWPMHWGDPAVTVPVPCEMVHMGTGKSCHYHAFSRFLRAFKFSLAMYLPIQLAVKMRKPSLKAVVVSLQEAIRSATFLGGFIGLFYYSVCSARTLVGPKLFSRTTITPQMWDSGLCVGAGCAACGLSIFLEKAQRRPELAFFVAPRAAAIFLPRRYEPKYLWREQLAFAIGATTLLTMVEENPKSARGLVSFVLSKILE